MALLSRVIEGSASYAGYLTGVGRGFASFLVKKSKKSMSWVEGDKRDYRNKMLFPSLRLSPAARSQVSAW